MRILIYKRGDKLSELPKAPTARLMKHAGAQRISGDAVDFFVETIEAYGMDIAAKANQLAIGCFFHIGYKDVVFTPAFFIAFQISHILNFSLSQHL